MNPYFNYKGAVLRGAGEGRGAGVGVCSEVLWRLRVPLLSGSFPFCPLPGVGLGQSADGSALREATLLQEVGGMRGWGVGGRDVSLFSLSENSRLVSTLVNMFLSFQPPIPPTLVKDITKIPVVCPLEPWLSPRLSLWPALAPIYLLVLPPFKPSLTHCPISAEGAGIGRPCRVSAWSSWSEGG